MKVLKIGAVWCPNCIVMRPRWEKIEKDFPNIETEYLDYDEHEDMLKEKYQIGDSLPVFIYLDKNGLELERQIGAVTSKEICQLLDRFKGL